MSTWGQLRFRLQTAAPGVPVDLLDEYLNTRYEQVLESTDWQGLRYFYTIETQAAYQSASDSVTLTVGSNAVTGTGTSWAQQQLTDIPQFYVPGDTVIYTATWVSSTQLTLDRGYEGNGSEAAGTVVSASPYVLMQNIYQLPTDVRSIVSIIDPVTGWPLNPMSKEELDASAGPRTLVNQQPVYYCAYQDSVESNPPVIHQVELFPPPQYARGYKLQYLHAATGFDGGNTSGSPMPWISDSVLLNGCRADIALYLAAQDPKTASAYIAQADRYEKLFLQELDRILLLEHAQKRQKRPAQMHPRFTRHRTIRATRPLNRNWGPGQGGPV